MSSESIEETSPHFVARFRREFFDVECTQLAKNLLGQILVKKEDECTLRARIVETEAYLGGEDLASHTHHGKLTDRTAPAFMDPGTMYVSPVYGMYHLFNISSKAHPRPSLVPYNFGGMSNVQLIVSITHRALETKDRYFFIRVVSGDGATVLLRALEPITGLEEMKRKRSMFGKGAKKALKDYKMNQVCNGPSKLAIAMSIDTRLTGDDLVTSPEIWVEAGPESIPEDQIIECPRIGVDFAGHLWAPKPLRYYILGNTCVSKRDRKAEKNHTALNEQANVDKI